jgi:hypothetical protein
MFSILISSDANEIKFWQIKEKFHKKYLGTERDACDGT